VLGLREPAVPSYSGSRLRRARRQAVTIQSAADPVPSTGRDSAMKAWTSKLAAATPPMWLTAVTAAVVAAALLTAFVDTLRENLRRGEDLRHAQAAAAGSRLQRPGNPHLRR
jgi:hypothetical protein